MNCCCSTPPVIRSTEKFFNKAARYYAKRYLKKGLEKEQRFLFDGITQTGPAGKSILDIGCGVGQIHFELLKRGAASAHGFDIAAGQLESARKFATQLNFADRVAYTQGDFLAVADSAREADITILDKVVCCYADPAALVDASLAKTRAVYALTLPRPLAVIRAYTAVLTLFAKLFGGLFHPYWHDWGKLVERIERAGFRVAYHDHTFVWDAYVFTRG